jgi:hypothetical protein
MPGRGSRFRSFGNSEDPADAIHNDAASSTGSLSTDERYRMVELATALVAAMEVSIRRPYQPDALMCLAKTAQEAAQQILLSQHRNDGPIRNS